MKIVTLLIKLLSPFLIFLLLLQTHLQEGADDIRYLLRNITSLVLSDLVYIAAFLFGDLVVDWNLLFLTRKPTAKSLYASCLSFYYFNYNSHF